MSFKLRREKGAGAMQSAEDVSERRGGSAKASSAGADHVTAHPAAHVTGRDVQREETRRRVRDAAVRVFRREGLAAAKIDDIAKIAGVSRGTFYFHYPTKEDVITEVLEEAEKRVAEAIAALPDDAAVDKVLHATCVAIAIEWGGEPDFFPDVGAVAVRRAASAFGGVPATPVRRELTKHFRAAKKRRELTGSMPPEVLADIFLVNVFAAALAWCARPSLALDEVLGAVALVFLNGARVRRR